MVQLPEGRMTIGQLTQDFEARCVKLAEDAEVVLRRRVPRFRGLLARRGAVGAAIYLIRAPRPSDTYTDLWAEGHLAYTVEAVILLEPTWNPLFTDDDRKAARARLQEYGWSAAGARSR